VIVHIIGKQRINNANQYLASTTGDGNRGDLHPSNSTFPLVEDDFRFEVRDGNARVTDVRSGAMWSISLN
jgi:hypothetical protein